MPLREMTWSVPEKEVRPRPRVTWPNPIKTTRSRIIWFCMGNPFFFSAATLLPPEKKKKESATAMKENILIKNSLFALLAVRKKKEKRSPGSRKKRRVLSVLLSLHKRSVQGYFLFFIVVVQFENEQSISVPDE
ncbi:hypothetical protein CEXT_206981 [Caerostris extrusa]|uniref:Uncharacterized protein n=1 Tax=Caerostris extrusa TaxID=172846 RepID=A0AAV4Q3D2_CAEEX|nr:hypothetical protein CEXT_206981 [Caerostris extrusa]